MICRTSATHSTCFFIERAWDQRTYSVHAAQGSGIGQAASVRMTKNGELHANAAMRFDADMIELGHYPVYTLGRGALGSLPRVPPGTPWEALPPPWAPKQMGRSV